MDMTSGEQFTAHYLRMKQRREEEERIEREAEEQRIAAHEAWKKQWKPHRDPAAAWL